MPLDAICLSALKTELSLQLEGSRIDKIQQPERDLLIFAVRGAGGTRRLLISAGSGDARVHLTDYQFENPSSPPMFCMLLRKHLTGARIMSVVQPRSERILEFVLSASDALGELNEKRLIVELIGRTSNIILADSDGTIIDCLRRRGEGVLEQRGMLPGLIYRPPAQQEGKRDPTTITQDEWRQFFYSSPGAGTAEKWLLSSFTALSPLICREITWRAYSDCDIRLDEIKDSGAALSKEFFSLMEHVHSEQFEPSILVNSDGSYRDFSYTDIKQYGNEYFCRCVDAFSPMLDEYFTRSAQQLRIRQRASDTTKMIKNARDRLVRKLAAQREELIKTEKREYYRQCGDLITSNLHLMKKGRSVLRADDYFSDDGGEREITLDPLKTPQQNAEKYYKEYTKAKNAEKALTQQIKLGEDELVYLDSVIGELNLAESERDILAVRNELTQTGYIRLRKQSNAKIQEAAPMQFESRTGMRIIAGRNNIQNDKLTLKTAAGADMWLHTQKIHGSHVIIECANGNNPPDAGTIEDAAVIAAFYSSAREATKVLVDYTLVRYVKKPQGSKPGAVIYTNYKTIIVNPNEELVNKMRRT